MRPGFLTADRVPNAQPIEKCASSEPAIYEVRGVGVKLKCRIERDDFVIPLYLFV
jgi:hypothetical protein